MTLWKENIFKTTGVCVFGPKIWSKPPVRHPDWGVGGFFAEALDVYSFTFLSQNSFD